MNYYVSVGTNYKSNVFVCWPLGETLGFLLKPENASVEKGGWLFHPAYIASDKPYMRLESKLERFSVIMIDCDNKTNDPDIINKWFAAMGCYDFIIYETYSSTKECPKFRAIIPMDEELQWSKNAKTAIIDTFAQFTDKQASWYYAPTRNKLDTVRANKAGIKFPAKTLKDRIGTLELMEKIEENQRALEHAKWEDRKQAGWVRERGRKDYHELPLVQEYMSAFKGERNSTAYKAACSMFARGYEDYEIKSMLNEGPLERSEITTVFNSAKTCRKR